MSKTPQEAIGAGKDGEQHAPIGSISAKENRRILDEISSQESSIAEVRGEIGGAWKQYERLGGARRLIVPGGIGFARRCPRPRPLCRDLEGSPT